MPHPTSIGEESILLRHLHTIEEVALQLINSDELIKNICREVYDSRDHQFDLVAIQLVRPEEAVIETVAGEGMAKQWAGRIGHHLVQDPGLRDIQADVVCMWNIELIEGSDPRGRFDPWVYKYYGHEGLKRAFLPIVVARNAQGAIMKAEEWCKHIRFDLDPLDEAEGLRLRTLRPRYPTEINIEVIGTLEVGYKQETQRRLRIEQAQQLFQHISTLALEIRRAQLSYLFEIILEQALDITRTDSANIFYAQVPQCTASYYYKYGRGPGAMFAEKHPPREDGLGSKALETDTPQFSDEDEKDIPIEMLEQGIRSIVAIPFPVKDRKGILYLHFREKFNQANFPADMLQTLKYFLNRVKTLLEGCDMLMALKSQSRRQENLLAMVDSMATRDYPLLEQIAHWTQNIFAADVVTIYEYEPDSNTFISPPYTGGRILAEKEMSSEVRDDDVPKRLLDAYEAQSAKLSNNILWADVAMDEDILYQEGVRPARGENKPFVTRESIKSCTAVVLEVQNVVVGEMFINYRRAHLQKHHLNERLIIQKLMPIVAFVIRSKRQLYRLVATKIESLIRLEDRHACENSPLFKLDRFFPPRELQYRAESYFLGHEFTPERISIIA